MSSGEHDRQIGNAILLGTVHELDEAEKMVRVDADGLITDWIPWLVSGANSRLRTWSAPELGEQVVVVCPYGDPAQGIVIGSIYQDDYDAPITTKTIDHAAFADGTIVEYDSAAHKLKINVGTGNVEITCQDATIKASGSVKLDTPSVVCTGDVSVQGNVVAQGDVKAGAISLKNHKHTGVQTGGGTTGPAV